MRKKLAVLLFLLFVGGLVQVIAQTPTTPVPNGSPVVSLNGCEIISAATTNQTICKNSAGNIYGYEVFNTTTTIYYLRLYNLSAAPTCSSAVGFIRSIPIPAAAASGQVGGIEANYGLPIGYSAGIAFCITGGSGSTDNTNAATGIFGEIRYK